MPAPNDFPVVQAVYATGQYDLSTHDGVCAFTEAVVIALHAKDAKWGHLKKHAGQTQCSGHAEDAALYKDSPLPGTLQAVDFVAGAGAPGARPAWQPDTPRYSEQDWYAPSGVPGPTPIPTPPPNTVPYHPYDGDQKYVKVTEVMDFDYRRAKGTVGQADKAGLDSGCGMWIARTIHDSYMGEAPGVAPLSLDASIAKHRAEWCQILGVPVVPFP